MKIKGISKKSNFEWLVFEADRNIPSVVGEQFCALFRSQNLRPRNVKVQGSFIYLEGLYAEDTLDVLVEDLLNQAQQVIDNSKHEERGEKERAEAELQKELQSISKQLNRPVV
jgi:hypothetical protein